MSETGNTGILSEPKPFGKYYLLERISVGGMAEIFKAKAFGVEGFERLLAVKRILDQIAEDEAFIEMFIDEAKIAGKLNHPNIAQIFDLGKEEGSYYIALEYISGKDLKTLLEQSRDRGEPLDIPQIVYTTMKVCEGLEHAHTKTDAQGEPLNIVHRDISPQNILISFEGEVKIIDFGIAKAQGKTSQTQVGVLKGKFSYMSPEQVRGLHVDHRSDIFSLGIVLYELLTLERLFLGDSDFDTLEQIRKVEISPPSLYNPDIPQELEDIVLKALARNPDDRFQSTAEFAEALERFMRSEGYYYKGKDLAAFMKEAYREDLEFERRKLEYYQNLDLKPPQQVTNEPEGLAWDDEEMETQIFDRDQPVPDVEAGQSQPDEAGVVYAENEAPAENEQPAAGGGEGVEVVGPDNEVDVITPEEEQNDGSAQDAATIEYDRDAFDESPIQHQQESGGRDGPGGPGSGAPSPGGSAGGDQQKDDLFEGAPPPSEGQGPRRRGSTAKLDEVDAERPTGAESGLRWQRVLAVALIVVVLAGGGALAVFQDSLFSGGDLAKLTFEPTPANVQISINGEKVHEGETPKTFSKEPGEVEVVVNKEGYKSYRKTLNLEPGTVHKIGWNLEKAPPTGTLVVKSSPKGANVSLDGESVGGTTPVTLPKTDRGDHELRLEKAGYQPHTSTVEVPGGEETTIERTLEPIELTLTLESEPSSASYRVIDSSSDDTVESGSVPDTVEGLDGSKTYRVEIERDDYEPWETTIEPGTESKREVSAELERARTEVASAEQSGSSAPEPTSASAGSGASDPGAGGSSGDGGGGSVGGAPSEGAGGGSEGSGGGVGSATDEAGGEAGEAEGAGGTEGASAQAEKGRLSIQSRPVAKVYIDGEDIGQRTPVINHEVSPGKHQIQLVNEEFGLNRTMYVDVAPGESKKVINTPDK